jgi:hypothetical protein
MRSREERKRHREERSRDVVARLWSAPTPPVDQLPPPPEEDDQGLSRPWLLATVLASAGLAMAIPVLFAMQTHIDPVTGFESYDFPDGWQTPLWVAAACVGLLSLVFALVDRRSATVKRSRDGRRRLAIPLTIAGIGALVWLLPVCVQAGTGL